MVAFFTALFARALPMPGWFYALLGLVLVVAGAAFGIEMIRMARHDENYRRVVFWPLLRWFGGIFGIIVLAIIAVVAISYRR